MEQIQFGLALDYDSGRYCTAATNGKIAIEVHCSQASDSMWYQIGSIHEATVKWGESERISRNGDFQNGYKPAIAMNNHGIIVEVHQTSNVVKKDVYANVGKVNGDKINWNTNKSFDRGLNPDVAINDNGIVVEIHETSNITNKQLYYNLGSVQGDHVKWEESHKCPVTGSTPSIALNNSGKVIAVYEENNKLFYMLGEVNSKKINWLTTATYYQRGNNPSISLTDDGRIVEVHESEGLTGLWQLSGKINADNTIKWSQATNFDTGSNPKVSVASDGNLALQVHSGSLFQLWYSTSRLMNTANFMADLLPTISALPLNKMVLPATHDAGMYTGGVSVLAKTQDLDLYQQLSAGARYFDLRPNSSLDIYHGPISGPPLQEVLKDIEKFFNEGHRELAILKFSHFKNFNNVIYQDMQKMITDHLGKWLYNKLPNGVARLADNTLGNYLSNGGKILILVDDDWAIDCPEKGFWVYRDWSSKHPEQGDITVYDEYSDKTSYKKMSMDQLDKLKKFNGKCKNNSSIPCDLFLLSWTLTPITDVWSYSKKANCQLGQVMSTQNPNRDGYFANLLYLDYFQYARPTWIASMLINRYDAQQESHGKVAPELIEQT